MQKLIQTINKGKYTIVFTIRMRSKGLLKEELKHKELAETEIYAKNNFLPRYTHSYTFFKEGFYQAAWRNLDSFQFILFIYLFIILFHFSLRNYILADYS